MKTSEKNDQENVGTYKCVCVRMINNAVNSGRGKRLRTRRRVI